jgi:hypothetical protein
VTSDLVPVDVAAIAIPNIRRGDTAEVFRLAAARVETQAINGNRTFARPELALAAAAGAYHRGGMRIPQPWILPLYRDAFGLNPFDLTDWEMTTPFIGRAMVLRALAHAIENGDLP